MDLSGPLPNQAPPTEKLEKSEKSEKKLPEASKPKKELLLSENLKVDEIFKWVKASQEGEGVLVSWAYADGLQQVKEIEQYQVMLYRFSGVPASVKNFNQGTLLFSTVIDKNTLNSKKEKKSFYDKINKTDVYYYHLFLSRIQENQLSNLKGGVNLVTSVNFESFIHDIFKSTKALSVDREGTVEISWEYYDGFVKNTEIASYKLDIYRSTNQIVDVKKLNKKTFLVSLDLRESSFKDRLTQKGIYYYNLFLFKDGEFFPKTVKLGVNQAKFEQPTNIFFENPFSSIAISQKKNIIYIDWTYSQKFKSSNHSDEHQIELYRFLETPSSMEQINKNTLLAKVFSDQTSYEDIPKKKGLYHYAIFLRKKGKVYPDKFHKNINFVTGIRFWNRLSQPLLTDLKATLKKYYYKKDYKNTIKKLKRYKKASHNKVKAIALFYIGLSFFKTKRYKESMSYFSHPSVIQNDEVRAKFWQKRASEHSEEK